MIHMNEMMETMREIHKLHQFKTNGGEDPLFRMNLIMEEVGEICSCLTKNKGNIAEEHADLLILLLGNCVALEIDIEAEFWAKAEKLKNYELIESPSGTHSRLSSKNSNKEAEV